MSAPDARLTPAERAALADLESAAAAADPELAARLKGAETRRLRPALIALRVRLRRYWARLLDTRRWSVPAIVAGLFFTVLGLSQGLLLSLLGVAVAAVGLRMAAETADRRLRRRKEPPADVTA
jgi:hypothetical protein